MSAKCVDFVVQDDRVGTRAVRVPYAAETGGSANLDVLRAAAVFYVFTYHVLLFARGSHVPAHVPGFHRWANLGHFGVLLFFVHTCLVLMRSLERLEHDYPRQSLFGAFFVRRCFRLFPLAVLVVCVIASLKLPVGHFQDGRFWPVPMRAVDVVANLLLVQNLVNVESLEAPLWSLPLELQMYLVLPAIYLAFCKGKSALPVLSLWLAVFALGLVWTRRPMVELFAYVPCFLAGVVAYKLPAVRRWSFLLWPAGLVLLTAVYLANASPLVSWCCCFAVGVLFPRVAELPKGRLRTLSKYVARYSYGIYLSHFALIWFAFVKLGGLPLGLRIAVFTLLAVSLPVLLFHSVEAPMMALGARLAARLTPSERPVRVLPLAAAALSVAVGLVALRRHAAAMPATTVPHEGVRLIGRVDERDPHGPRLAWPGTGIEVRFSGASLDVELDDRGNNFFSVTLDGQTPSTFSTLPGRHVYPLFRNLSAGAHTLVLTKRTEAMVGVVQLLDVRVEEGRLLAKPVPPARRIEFVGDSIACGYGVLGADAECRFSPETEASDLSYATLAARELGAEPTILAYAGKGMFRDYQGATGAPMSALYRRALPDDPSSSVSSGSPPPSVVVIDLGTNDFDAGDPGVAFQRAYVAFVQQLRREYPKAHFVCAVSAMLVDPGRRGVPRRAAAAAAIRGAVDELTHRGDHNVEYFAFDQQDSRNGYGCDEHPSRKTQQVMAAQLVHAIRARLDW